MMSGMLWNASLKLVAPFDNCPFQMLSDKKNVMRLSKIQQQYILQATRQNFGTDAKVWLFGSRVDDAQRGGDVDLYVETTQSNAPMAALHCKISIEESLDLHVDLVVNDHVKDEPIYHIAKKKGVLL